MGILLTILIGFLAGSLLGIPIGLVMGSFGSARKVLEPYTEFLRFIPAVAMIGFWVVMQLLFGYLTVSAPSRGAESGGVAWFAHIGGFLAGVVLLFLIRPPRSARS